MATGLATGVVTASSAVLAASLESWASFAASMVAIAGGLYGLWRLHRGRRRRHDAMPKPPPAGASPADWEEFRVRFDQWHKDREDR